MQTPVLKRRLPRGGRLAAPLLFLTLALSLLAGAYQSHRREQRNRSLRPITYRAIALCTAFSDSCEVTGAPILWEENRMCPVKKSPHRSLWSIECLADGRGYAMVFDAKTRELSAIFAQGCARVSTFQGHPVLAVRTPSQAVESSLRLMRKMELVPAGSRIALAETPVLLRHKEAWQVLWKILRPESTQPTRLKLLVDRYSGVPVVVVNSHALAPSP